MLTKSQQLLSYNRLLFHKLFPLINFDLSLPLSFVVSCHCAQITPIFFIKGLEKDIHLLFTCLKETINYYSHMFFASFCMKMTNGKAIVRGTGA